MGQPLTLPGAEAIITDKVVVVPTQACGPSVQMGLPDLTGSPALEGLPARRPVKSNVMVSFSGEHAGPLVLFEQDVR